MSLNGIFQQLAGGAQFGGFGVPGAPRPLSAFDEYLRAYSVAMLPGRERENVSYGGKIIMPPSALANLTNMDLPSPWMFQLRNPNNPAASTHAGVLEFIAQEGCVHLPHWMMKTLRLNEGEPIRITGADMPKGKLVKLQAQHVHFLEISDPKAVLEQALRNFTCLTQGDIIEISYNSIVFGLLVMETQPGGGGICVLDTDLEVDFAAPLGYVEPERPKAAPLPTMKSKLGIDLDSASPGSSRPASSLGGGFTNPGTASSGVSKGGESWEVFKGRGETLGGRKTKGKGVSVRKAEPVAADSKIYRTDRHRIVNNEVLEQEGQCPAALNVPFGQLFFGFKAVQYIPKNKETGEPASDATPFTGSGQSLSGKTLVASTSSKGKEKAAEPEESSAKWTSLGGGTTLGKTPKEVGEVGAGGARVPRVPRRTTEEKERSPSPDWGVDDDDVVMYDSD
ncbi:UFD1-domain-containing protein [Cylindrobasidium torrendii FP15055 ss-10]|uniref:UFD1-domain-containing protein n=1 Tax=Cylindrobasidium torrendii FP15055 ss-10 TaxID=1314674 RepID=A0A0D7BR27_9AGAR|nr:UFD1-domain-containing protein [Cylindrobasidium torrendii FP15055 ss-10]